MGQGERSGSVGRSLTPVRIRLLLVGFAARFLLAGCASYSVLELPIREADLYPEGETRSGISIAIDEISDPVRVQRYFATDLLRYGILPVQVIVSNYGEHRIAITPSDVLLMRGSQVVGPIPMEVVAQLPIRDRIFVSRKRRDRVWTSMRISRCRNGLSRRVRPTRACCSSQCPNPGRSLSVTSRCLGRPPGEVCVSSLRSPTLASTRESDSDLSPCTDSQAVTPEGQM